MIYIVFTVQNEKDFKNVCLSLTNISPELSERNSILVLASTDLYLDCRNKLQEYLEGAKYWDFMCYPLEKDTNVYHNLNYIADITSLVILVKPSHILQYGSIHKLMMAYIDTFNSKAGLIAMEKGSKRVLSEDLYSGKWKIIDNPITADYEPVDSIISGTVITSYQNLIGGYTDDLIEYGLFLRRLGFSNYLLKETLVTEDK